MAVDWKGKEYPGWKCTVQVFPDDCTGCGMCVDVCPAKSKEVAKHKAINMEPKLDHLAREQENLDFFLGLPDVDRTKVKADTVKGSQLLLPLFEFSGACAGCGETPYVKLLTQFFGDRMMIGNATGCSSIYGGNLPCTPYTVDRRGQGPELVQLAVRGLRRVRLRLAAGRRPADRLLPRSCCGGSPARWATSWSRPCSPTRRRPTRRSPRSGPWWPS